MELKHSYYLVTWQLSKCHNTKFEKINKAVAELSKFNLSVDEEDIKELPEMVPEELTSEELLELEQEQEQKLKKR